jgi:membrane peptidoglycan carboxypeptidase
VILGAGLLGTASALGGLGYFAVATRQNPNNTFTREGIMQILSKESTVYYSDGKTKVGTFFEGQHRDYVPYDSIPKILIDALVSAEDQNYFTHGGVDFKALAYAMLDNAKAMKLKRGGSTLTQQTAKNLFNRRGRSISGKLKELVNAYRLERNFTKEEILEFYLNQFYVSGNGHGVRIAARYFFNKELGNLNLLECAFIAGSVKGPNQYNPFIQPNAERKAAAVTRARHRVAYVLKQLYRHGKIDKAQYAEAMRQKLEFRRGSFRFSLSTNMVKAKRLLESKAMQEVLGRYDVADFMTEGLQITTTLDANLQRAAEYASYANLARLDLILRGYRPPKDSQATLVTHFVPGSFYTGRVISVPEEAPAKGKGAKAGPVRGNIELAFGTARGVITPEAFDRFLRNWNRHETGIAQLPTAAVRAEILKKHFAPGKTVYCGLPYSYDPEQRASARISADSSDKPVELEIAQKPEIQGGSQILKEGRVLANVGGFGNTGYDRVNQARRQFGSTFKPIVYAAALEQGWGPLDPLPNFRQLFRLGTVFYFPKPDHAPEDTVSMAWAGRRSENIASVYLLFHLFDKTPFARFWEVARDLGMAPENFDMQGEFEIFVRDSLGLVLDRERGRELLYQKEAGDLAIDLTFEGRVGEAEALKTLPYGLGYARERQKYAGSGDREDRLRRRILGRTYLAYMEKARVQERGDMGREVHLARSEADGRLGLFSERPDSGWIPLAEPEWWVPDSLHIEGEVTIGTLKRLEAKLAAREDEESPGYTKDNLYNSRDFRALAALRYIVQFSRRLGLTSPLEPVISFPLGVNVITLGEAANAYQALKDGYVYRTKFGEPQLFIERIALPDGTVIFEDYLEREKVISERTRLGVEAILASVVNGGTGQQIQRELKVAAPGGVEISLPAYGKTGTTNDYRNGAFLGYIAAPKGLNKGFDAPSGFTIGAYVGFDDNAVMVRRGFKGTGSSVAIPAWIAQARAVAEIDAFADRIDLLDLEVQATGSAPFFQQEKYNKVIVSRRTGLPIHGADEQALRAEAGTYVEDLSDELGADEEAAAAVPASDPASDPVFNPASFSTLYIRDE